MHYHDTLITRTESSRSLEDREKYQALETLKQLGLLIPLSDVDTFHGRVRQSGETDDWYVDPNFRNGGNDSGHSNVNERTSLYAASRTIAQDFADARKKAVEFSTQHNYQDVTLPTFSTEVHEVVSSDADASIITTKFAPSSLSSEDQQAFMAALQQLAPPVTRGAPVPFQYRDAAATVRDHLRSELSSGRRSLYTNQDIATMSQRLALSEEITKHMTSAFNARVMCISNPAYVANRLMQERGEYIDMPDDNRGQTSFVPISVEYAESFFRNAHIVGVQQTVISGTLRGREITMAALFDLDKIDAKGHMEKRRKHTERKLGAMATEFDMRNGAVVNEQQSVAIERLLLDAHVKPGQLVAAAKEVKGFEEVFDADAGNWEGYTVGQHTETVLRNFDESFADDLPVSMLRPMRLTLLVHDIGKADVDRTAGEHHQEAHNAMRAQQFLEEVGVDAKTTRFITATTLVGMSLIHEIDIDRAGKEAHRRLEQFAKKTLIGLYDRSDVTQEEIDGYIDFCRMAQMCDGGAYTSMATTTSKDGVYKNAPVFNRSFPETSGLGRHKLRQRASRLSK